MPGTPGRGFPVGFLPAILVLVPEEQDNDMIDKPPEIQDPYIKPEGYKPPTSAEELLERYERGERYFVGAELEGGRC